MPLLHHQLTAYSPLSTRNVLTAALSDVSGTSVHSGLSQLLLQRYGADAVLLTGSGTMALQVALSLAVSGRGAKEIALPAFACYQLAAAGVWVARSQGIRVTLYDVDASTLSPDWDSFERALTPATVAVVAPFFGIPVDWQRVVSVASRRGAFLIEDAAQGHGGTWLGAPLGSQGELAVLSFGRAKGWTGIAGGALLARGEWTERVLAARLAAPTARRRAAHLAAMLGQWVFARPSLYGLPAAIPALGLGETRYEAAQSPTAMITGAGDLIRASVAAADREAEERRQHAREWQERLRDVPGLHLFQAPAHGAAGYLRFPVSLAGGFAALSDQSTARRLGIAPTYPSALADLAAIRALLTNGARHAGADALVKDVITLPTHSLLSGGDRQRLLRLLSMSSRSFAARNRSSPSHPCRPEPCVESQAS